MQTELKSVTQTTVLSPAAALQFSQPGDAEVDIEVLSGVPKAFAIDCEDHANWLVKKIVSARSYADHVKKWAEQEQRRAEREEHTLMFLFGRQLEMWARDQIALLHKRKSLALPAGTVGFRTIAAKLVIDDEKRVLMCKKFFPYQQ